MKTQVSAASKSAKLLFVIYIYAAAVIDWAKLLRVWSEAVSGATLHGDLPFLEGTSSAEQEGHILECKAGSVTFSVAPGETPTEGVATINGVLEGVDENSLEVAYGLQGEEVVAIVERCSDGKKFIFANPCTGGAVFQYQTIGAQDGGEAGISFTLTGKDCPQPMLVYEPAVANPNLVVAPESGSGSPTKQPQGT